MFVRRLSSIFSFVAVSILFFSSCKFNRDDFKDLKLAKYSPEWGLSLIKSDIYLSSALNKINSESSQFEATVDNGVLTLNYFDTVDIAKGEDFFKSLNNYSTGSGLEVGQSFVNVVSALPLNIEQNSNYSTSGNIPLVIDLVSTYSRLKVKSGLLKITGLSQVKHDISFDVEFTTVTKGGSNLKRRLKFIYDGNDPVVATVEDEDMAGYTITPSSVGSSDIPFTIKNVSIKRLNNDIISGNNVNAADSLKFVLSFQNLMIDEADVQNITFISSIPADDDGKINISIFNNSLNKGNVFIKDPSIRTTALNELPLKASIGIDSLSLSYAQLPTKNIQNFTSPSTTIPGNLTINASNTSNPETFIVDGSTVQNPFEKTPNKLSVKFNNITLSSPANQIVTVKTSQRVRMFVKVKLPLEGYANDIAISDTNLIDAMPKAGVLQNLELSIFSDNQYPFDLGFRAYFLDTNKTVLFTLPRMTESNLVISSNTLNYKKSFSLSKSEYEQSGLERASKVVLEGVFNTQKPNQTIVKISKDQFCRIQIAAKAKTTIDLGNTDQILNENNP
jgi:hypothetical protein